MGICVIRHQNKRDRGSHSTVRRAQTVCAQKSDLTFVKEAAHGIALQEVRVLGHAVHVSHRVVQIEHVLGCLLVPMDDSRGVLHPKHLQEPLDGSRADLLRLVLGGEVILQVAERRPCGGGAQQRRKADHKHQHLGGLSRFLALRGPRSTQPSSSLELE